ncbi:MAG: type II CRISPR RNA-guided endonuclease Cas9 [Bacteroidales bacterium]|nr:type II CRISPR RNA-guided endonuclease Cas9 [Bacteroidales bacterium]
MKKILGLDLGTNSIGWAVVNEAENETEQSSIIKIGVRVNPLTTDELGNFEKGKSITTNSDRTLKRSARRNLQRYKLRKEALIKILKNNNFISDDTILSEQGNKTTFETYSLRAKAVEQEITLTEFARVLLMLNKKRGYKSSRKAKSTDEGQLIDGMSVARELYDRDLTPGQFLLEQIYKGVKTEPDFYRSDLQSEFDKIWEFQKQYYSELFTDELKEQLKGKNKGQTWTICQKAFNIEGESRTTKGVEQKIENYQWRANSLKEQMTLEQLTIVFQEINNQLNKSSNYLGNISDRSKELYFNHQTVGQYLYEKLSQNSHYSTKNKVFYRQDYLDEFETLWETQSKYHKELTDELKKEIRDVIIFYQRPLKSQKGLLSICELEGREIEIEKNGKKIIKIIGPRVSPKSSPIFQESKIWQILNNVQIEGNVIPNVQQDLFGEATEFKYGKRPLTQEEKQTLFAELNIKEKLTESQALQILEMKGSYKLNYKEIEGNKTRASFFKAFQEIIELSGHEIEFTKKKAHKIEEELKEIFVALGFSTEILGFKTDLTKEEIKDQQIEKQAYYKLWHLLYSFEGDSSKLGNEKLIQKVMELCKMPKEYATILSNITFPLDYSSLSTRATLKILPFLKQGLMYSDACEKAGYKHSKKSLTKEEIENKILKDSLSQLPKNSLRNPVVEKILNQMVNVVNSLVEEYGKPDEIRIELARELKKSAKERDELTKAVNSSKKDHEKIVSILQSSFNIQNPSRNDIIRYKLYEELKPNGYHTLYTNTYIPQEKLFSKDFDIEHIIPQALLFDDSFANKTLEKRDANIEKGRMTAYDYVLEKRGEQGIEEYKSKIDNLNISSSKRKKLLMRENDIPNGFIDRDLRNSQYISKKSREILEQIVKVVNTTTGSVTDRLREDWQLVDVMKELNWNKYDKCGQTESYTNRDGNVIKKIKDWTKRNDHRHHAMDALTIAFTKPSYIQYLNNLNARVEKSVEEYLDLDNVEIRLLDKDKRSSAVYGIETKELYRDNKGKLRFKPPMPLDELRKEAKKHLEDTLVSIKAKNKVVTRNTNIIKTKNGEKQIIQQTPRGQLHLETIYGRIKQYETKEETVNASFDIEKIQTVANKEYRDALLKRLQEFNNDPKKAFTGKNTLEKNPIWLNKLHTDQVPTKVKIVNFVNVYTIRKPIDKDLKIDKVVDVKIRKILEARLEEYGGKANDAFSNLDENPIWLNKEKGIAIKRVTITGISNATALRSKRDKEGNFILNEDGTKQAVDFVNTGNNHHVAIYRKPVLDKKTGQQQFDDNGNAKFELEEKVVSFFEATIRANNGEPIIDKTYNQDKGWQFLFSMKQNEYFVFPRYETTKDVNGNEVTIKVFDPTQIDLRNPENYSLISTNLFRVQKISTKNYVFRHHLETKVDDTSSELKGVIWRDFRSTKGLDEIIKVRVNHIGQIVEVGEY